MNKNILTMMALAMSAVSLSQGAESFDFNTWLPGRFKLFDAERDNAKNPWVQSFDLRSRPQYQWGDLDSAMPRQALEVVRTNAPISAYAPAGFSVTA